MKSYYAFEGEIHYYGRLPRTIEVVPESQSPNRAAGDLRGVLGSQAEPNRWKEPPHVVLSNLEITSEIMASFIKKFGPLMGKDAAVFNPDADHFYESLDYFKQFQDVLRSAWKGDDKSIHAIQNRAGYLSPLWMGTQKIQIAVDDLQQLLCLLFLRDRAAGKIAVCANPDCPAPFFVRSRKGQRFCTHKCAVLINVRKFRKAQAEKKTRRKR
jgi:hypothetical protein